MPTPHTTTLMPVGTVVEHPGGLIVKKTHASGADAYPWTTIAGGEFSDEAVADLLCDGAQMLEKP